jgi:predicted ester cyclase
LSDQAIPDFPERVQRAVAEADTLASELRRQGGPTGDITASPTYQELVRLKVILEVETSRTLSETARISAELERTDLADRLAAVEEEL